MYAEHDLIRFTKFGLTTDEVKTKPVKDKIEVSTWQIPEELFEKCSELAKKLAQKHPKWTSDKLSRKVAERFKLKKAEPVNSLSEIVGQWPGDESVEGGKQTQIL